MANDQQPTKAGAVELEEDQLAGVDGGGEHVSSTIVSKIADGSVKPGDGSVKPGDGSVAKGIIIR